MAEAMRQTVAGMLKGIERYLFLLYIIARDSLLLTLFDAITNIIDENLLSRTKLNII